MTKQTSVICNTEMVCDLCRY